MEEMIERQLSITYYIKNAGGKVIKLLVSGSPPSVERSRMFGASDAGHSRGHKRLWLSG